MNRIAFTLAAATLFTACADSPLEPAADDDPRADVAPEEAEETFGFGTNPNAEPEEDAGALIVAQPDNDTFDFPLFAHDFNASTVKNVSFRDAVSAPDGDREDWFRVDTPSPTSNAPTLFVSFNCRGETDAFHMEIYEDDGFSLRKIPGEVRCNTDGDLPIDGNSTYLFRVTGNGAGEGFLEYDVFVSP